MRVSPTARARTNSPLVPAPMEPVEKIATSCNPGAGTALIGACPPSSIPQPLGGRACPALAGLFLFTEFYRVRFRRYLRAVDIIRRRTCRCPKNSIRPGSCQPSRPSRAATRRTAIRPRPPYRDGVLYAQRREDKKWLRIPPAKVEHNRDNPDGRNKLCAPPHNMPQGDVVFCWRH